MLSLLCFVILLFTLIYLITNISSIKTRLDALEKKSKPASTPPVQTFKKPETPTFKQQVSPTFNVEKPNIIAEKIRTFLTTRNAIALVGGLLLLFGCGFLVKYAAEHGMLTIQWRLIITSVIGLFALAIGFITRNKQTTVALVLQGVGLGIIYLTVFACFQFYALVSITAAFLVLAAVAALGVFLSTWQNAKYLALFSFFGGFLAPLLLQSNEPNITALFSYYLILNIGIFIIAWFKQWRELNYLGFLATFVVTGLWTYQSYTDAYFTITEIFLILFFILYLIIAIIFSYKQTHTIKKIIDTTLTFALPLIFFVYQAKLLHYNPMRLAIFSFALAILYSVISLILHFIKTQNRPILFAMLACAVIFFTAAIPLALQNHWTGITWALEGAAVFWYGWWQKRTRAIFAGIILQLAASLAFIYYFPPQTHTLYLLNGTFLGALILILSAYFSAYVAKENNDFSLPFFILGTLWFIFIGVYENWTYFHQHTLTNFTWLIPHQPYWQFIYGIVLFFTGANLIAAIVNRLTRFSLLKILFYISVSVILFAELNTCFTNNTFAYYFFEPYLAAFVISFISLYLFKNNLSDTDGFWFTALLWLATLIQLGLCIGRFNHAVIPNEITLQYATAGVGIALYYLVFECGNVLRVFPFSYQPNIYARYTPLCLIAVFLAWFVSSTINSTAATPHMIYLPLLNPLDLTTGLILFSIYYWQKPQQDWLRQQLPNWNKACLVILYSVGFIWANAILLRTLHHWIGLPLSTSTVMNSATAQISISILWAIIALTLTIGGSILHKRAPWIIGASLIGVTVVKILLVDLSNQNTITRIISFISVGILLLLIGYFAPLPPKKS